MAKKDLHHDLREGMGQAIDLEIARTLKKEGLRRDQVEIKETPDLRGELVYKDRALLRWVGPHIHDEKNGVRVDFHIFDGD